MTAETNLGPARRSVVDALRAHGLSGAVAAAVWSVARRLVTRTRRRGFEHADTLDAVDGKPIGPTLTGTVMSTDLSPHIAKFRTGREYVQVHTHLTSTSFSHRDLYLLADQDAISVIVAIGIDGTWYVASRTQTWSLTNPRVLLEQYLAELGRLDAEEMTAAERPHVATERLAARYGLRYDRIKGLADARPPT